MMKICYIVGAGEHFSRFFPTEDDFVIAADAGYLYLAKYGIRCDLIVGDFDSMKQIPPHDTIERHPTRKDDTDTALAFEAGYARGYRDFVILGATGGREDHTFANYQLLYHIRKMGARALLVGKTQLVECMMDETREFSGNIGANFSLFAFGADARGVTLDGLSYEMKNGEFFADVALGVSNSYAKQRACVTVREGALLVIRDRKKTSHFDPLLEKSF